jgi:hypothetical protein
MRYLGGLSCGQGGMAARFESGAAEAEGVGQKARERVHLDHNQEPAGVECGEDLSEDEIRICHVVEGRGRPNQVNGVDGRPRRVQVRLDGADPVGHAEIVGSSPEAVQQLRGYAQGDRVGPLEALEALEQSEGAGGRVQGGLDTRSELDGAIVSAAPLAPLSNALGPLCPAPPFSGRLVSGRARQEGTGLNGHNEGVRVGGCPMPPGPAALLARRPEVRR